MIQYVPSGVLFGRINLGGKIVRQTLKTDTFTTAKLRLGDFLKAQQKRVTRPLAGTFAEARAKYETDIDADHTLNDGSKLYRRNCVKTLLRTWPDLDAKPPAKITESECREWAGRLAGMYDYQFFNNTLGTLRQILKRAGLGRDDNPAFQVKRLGVKPKEFRLPEPKEFEALVEELENGGARQSKDCADLVRFIVDASATVAQVRRSDGASWAGGPKAWTLAGSKAAWPIGIGEAASFPTVALVEGGPDLLALCAFIVAEGRERDCVPVAMLGGCARIHPVALPKFAGKRVRIFPRVDDVGDDAANRWAAQLAEAGAKVDAFHLAGLRRKDGASVKDLCDLAAIHADDFEDDRSVWRILP